MEAYAQALSYGIPFFIVLILIEWGASRVMGRQVYRSMDTIASLSSGMTNTIKSLIGLSIVIISYSWMEETFGIFDIESTLWLYVIAFVGIDFASYWSHRFNHVVNIFWNRHIIHHSSEEYNLACALRQEISAIVVIYFFLYIPMAVMGVPAHVIAVLAPIHLFAQFWYHTKLINKMGILEHVLMTPSHHRVHHAINAEYIDKNYSAILIIWDKWFGTFQEERADIPPVYGILKPAQTWNPLVINFMHAWQIAKDAWRTQSWKDKVRIWFMRTGWRPDDVSEKYPIAITTNVYNRPKYNPTTSSALKIWSWIQLVVVNLFIYHALISFGNLEYLEVMYYLAFCFAAILAYTSLMEYNQVAMFFEVAKVILAASILYLFGEWFDAEQYVVGATWVVIGYCVVSLFATIWFLYFEPREEINLVTTITK